MGWVPKLSRQVLAENRNMFQIKILAVGLRNHAAETSLFRLDRFHP
jgi:hypothetical protein